VVVESISGPTPEYAAFDAVGDAEFSSALTNGKLFTAWDTIPHGLTLVR